MSASLSPSRTPGPVDRAFGLLQLVVAANEPIGIRELGRRAGLSPSTTSRTIGILADLGMVERGEGGTVRPGPSLTTLTSDAAASPAAVRARFRPLAVDLAETFGENAAITIDDSDGLLYLTSSRLSSAVQVADPAGSAFPFHLVAPGIVAMTAWEEHRLDAYLGKPLEPATDFSVIKPAAIRRRVRRARSDGFVWTDQELDIEVNGLAAPIHSDDGHLIAVATLYGPSYRLAPELRPDVGAEFSAYVTERAADLA